MEIKNKLSGKDNMKKTIQKIKLTMYKSKEEGAFLWSRENIATLISIINSLIDALNTHLKEHKELFTLQDKRQLALEKRVNRVEDWIENTVIESNVTEPKQEWGIQGTPSNSGTSGTPLRGREPKQEYCECEKPDSYPYTERFCYKCGLPLPTKQECKCKKPNEQWLKPGEMRCANCDLPLPTNTKEKCNCHYQCGCDKGECNCYTLNPKPTNTKEELRRRIENLIYFDSHFKGGEDNARLLTDSILLKVALLVK